MFPFAITMMLVGAACMARYGIFIWKTKEGAEREMAIGMAVHVVLFLFGAVWLTTAWLGYDL